MSPSCHFDMHHLCLTTVWPTCLAYIDGSKLENSSFRMPVLNCCTRTVCLLRNLILYGKLILLRDKNATFVLVHHLLWFSKSLDYVMLSCSRIPVVYVVTVRTELPLQSRRYSWLKLNFLSHLPWEPVSLNSYWPAKYSTVPIFSCELLVF